MAIQVSSATARLTRDRVELLGTRVDRIALSTLPEWLEAFLASGEPHQIVTANLDFVATARKHAAFARVIEEADLVVCDGKPLQWAARLQGSPIPSRVTGMDLVMQAAKLSAERGYRLFLLGAAPGVARQAADRLEEFFPGVQIAGIYSPPVGEFSDIDNRRMVDLIRASGADALFVALGAPRQDIWIAAHLQELGVPLCAGIGGVFNFLSGRTRRAPRWMQQAGLEWAFRLMQEPSRLWRRYLVNDLPIFFELLSQQVATRIRERFGRVRDEEATLRALTVSPNDTGHPSGTSAPVRQGAAAQAGSEKHSVRARRSALRQRRLPHAAAVEGGLPEDEGRVTVQESAWNSF